MGADVVGTADASVLAHNQSSDAHTELFKDVLKAPEFKVFYPDSGTPLDSNTIYYVSDAVETYVFSPPIQTVELIANWSEGEQTAIVDLPFCLIAGNKYNFTIDLTTLSSDVDTFVFSYSHILSDGTFDTTTVETITDFSAAQTIQFTPTYNANYIMLTKSPTATSSEDSISFTIVGASGWAHGMFTTSSAPDISFTDDGTRFVGESPNFEASTTYEFDVLDGVWVFAEVGS